MSNDAFIHDVLRETLQRIGVVAQADLARRWGLRPSVVHSLVHREDFPAPFGLVASKSLLWFADECDDWAKQQGYYPPQQPPTAIGRG